MKFTFSYLILNNRDFNKHDIYIKVFAFLFPIIPTWIILNFTKWSANLITIIGFCFGTLGAILGYYISIEYLLYGFLIFLILDFVDGNVAIARGGGTFLGTILDMTSDRIILFASVFTLIHYHLLTDQGHEIMLLLTYLLSFILLDILQLAFLRANKLSSSNLNEEGQSKRMPNNFKTIMSNPIIWIPSRLSSYLFIIIVLLITGLFSIAYWMGIFCVGGEYLTSFIKYLKILNERVS